MLFPTSSTSSPQTTTRLYHTLLSHPIPCCESFPQACWRGAGPRGGSIEKQVQLTALQPRRLNERTATEKKQQQAAPQSGLAPNPNSPLPLYPTPTSNSSSHRRRHYCYHHHHQSIQSAAPSTPHPLRQLSSEPSTPHRTALHRTAPHYTGSRDSH